MEGRAIRYFFAGILCVVACRVLLLYPLDRASEKLTEISFRNVEQEDPAKHSTIFAAKPNSNPGFALPISVCEKEETDDEDEASDVHDQPVNLPGRHSEATFVDLQKQPRKVSPVPLFILLHSWRHFLS